MKRTFIHILAICILVPAAAAVAAPAKTRLVVAAAANLGSVADNLKAAFNAVHPGIEVDFVLGSSGALATQIENGAPFHVFMAADTGFPDRIVKAGLASGAAKIYARGKLALFSVKPRDFSAGLALLAAPDVERIAIANPETAPYGSASVQALRAAGLWDSVKGKIVTAQNIAQAVQYALTAADLGFVNKSALYTKDLAAYADKEGINWIEVDPSTHDPIDQAFVVLKTAGDDPAAAAFAAFLGSEPARKVFLAAGYAVAQVPVAP
jgi:molybdate transport system substrate-binding protein